MKYHPLTELVWDVKPSQKYDCDQIIRQYLKEKAHKLDEAICDGYKGEQPKIPLSDILDLTEQPTIKHRR